MSTKPFGSLEPPTASEEKVAKSQDASEGGTEAGARRRQHRRSNSFIMVKHVRETPDEVVDQSVAPNVNAEWVNMKGMYRVTDMVGAWVIHVVLITLAKLIINEVPGISDAVKWSIVNLGYMLVSYCIFHYVKGAPQDLNSGAYDELTLWEQIDQGYQYTPAKKYLTSLPIAMFLLSTHYSHYNPWLFSLNLAGLLLVLFPKLPVLHRLRFLIFPPAPASRSISGTSTPVHS